MTRFRTLFRSVAPLTLLVTAPLAASAHPGHGHHSSETLLHYVAEPWHMGGMVVSLVCTAALAFWLASRSMSKRRVG